MKRVWRATRPACVGDRWPTCGRNRRLRVGADKPDSND